MPGARRYGTRWPGHGQRLVADGEDELPRAPGNGAGAKVVAAGSDSGQRSVEGFPCIDAGPALNVAVTRESDELDAEATLEGAAGGAQRLADGARTPGAVK